MKSQELRKLIREEVKKTLNEGTQLPKGSTADEVVQTIQPILDKLEADIQAGTKNIAIAFTKKKSPNSKGPLQYYNLAVTRKGIGEVNKLLNAYKDLSFKTEAYLSWLETPSLRRSAPKVLDEVNQILRQYGL